MTEINQELLIKAIDKYELYSLSQRRVLRILVMVAIDNIASVTNKYLMEKTKLSRYSIHLILKKLEQEKFIERIRLDGARHDSFKINYFKLNEVIQLYLKKESI